MKEEDGNHGKVLFTSTKLHADEHWEAETNVVGHRPTERHGDRGAFKKGVQVLAGGPPRDFPPAPERPAGTVLYSSPTRVEGNGKHTASHPPQQSGLFQPGVHVLSGGPPREVPMTDIADHGVVLRTSETLGVDPAADDGEVNERGERVSSGHGGFTHGVVEAEGGPLRIPPPPVKEDLDEMRVGHRRGSTGHFIAGTTVMLGGTPKYGTKV